MKRVEEMSRGELERECRELGGDPDRKPMRELRTWVQILRKQEFEKRTAALKGGGADGE